MFFFEVLKVNFAGKKISYEFFYIFYRRNSFLMELFARFFGAFVINRGISLKLFEVIKEELFLI